MRFKHVSVLVSTIIFSVLGCDGSGSTQETDGATLTSETVSIVSVLESPLPDMQGVSAKFDDKKTTVYLLDPEIRESTLGISATLSEIGEQNFSLVGNSYLVFTGAHEVLGSMVVVTFENLNDRTPLEINACSNTRDSCTSVPYRTWGNRYIFSVYPSMSYSIIHENNSIPVK